MKYLIILFIFIGLFGCEHHQEPKYNQQAIALNNKAIQLLLAKKLDSALIVSDQAIELDNRYYLPHSNKVSVYLMMKEYNKALHESEMVIKKKPDLAEGWFFSGILNEHQGNKNTATTCYQKSIQIFTDRINNPEKQKDINGNKLNRALSKRFVQDSSYMDDFNELIKLKDYTFLVNQFKNKSKEEIMSDFLK